MLMATAVVGAGVWLEDCSLLFPAVEFALLVVEADGWSAIVAVGDEEAIESS